MSGALQEILPIEALILKPLLLLSLLVVEHLMYCCHGVLSLLKMIYVEIDDYKLDAGVGAGVDVGAVNKCLRV